MLKILVLIVFSLISIANAKNIPLVQNLVIYIPVKEFSIVEFPFLIKAKRFTPFVYKIKLHKIKNSHDPLKTAVQLPTISSNNGFTSTPIDVKKIFDKKKKAKALSVSWGKNFAQFYPRYAGNTEVVIWGYKKYPILLKIVATKDIQKADRYIKFINYDKSFKVNQNFQDLSHEKICSRLIYLLYNNKTPGGFKNETEHKEYKSKNFNFILIRSIIGKYYSATEYKITNISNKKIILNEPMFASVYTYAISIENRDLKSGETTRMFVVTPTLRQ